MNDVSEITEKAISSKISIGKAVEDTFKATSHGESVIKLSGKENPVMLNRVLHVPDAEHSLNSVSSLCDDDATVDFTNRKCVVRKDRCMVGVGERAGKTHSVNLHQSIDKQIATSDITGDMLSVW